MKDIISGVFHIKKGQTHAAKTVTCICPFLLFLTMLIFKLF
ncbi:hypothetical protein CLOSTHATH_04481 [Hungatella hathewayi DSM 13479]|uniref:Uncharacterized protein n=1 Tax=Hungatella hathewayi DSM 13479 TaxID=566550 RepID=D3ALI5_9FIRM|nr:hypothetical protein CLOSTHATH_04481 [Hungatella hathewayi DSM 13479]